MSQLNQREAVYVTTMNVLADNNVPFDDGQNVSEFVTKPMRASIIGIITTGILNREVEMSDDGRAKHDTEAKVKTYVNGLVSNWFRKDPRLNGGTKHQAKNPGSRVGSQDEQIKALKTLRAVKADDAEAVAAIDAAIKARQAEIKPTKTVELTAETIDLLPADLKAKFGL